jgi:hypothetical protein
MSRLISGVHVFSYFTEFDYGISPSKTVIGKIHSMDDYNKLIPSPDTRVEIDRAPGKEEIRVIKDETGDYHVTADHDIARDVLKEIDQQTIDIFKPDINPYPKSFSNLKNEDYFRDIIRYDEAGNRILPGIRRVGFLSTMEEYNAMENDDVVWYESWKFTGVENTRTGDVWWTTDALKKEILQRRPPQDKEDEATPQGEGETSDDQ